MHNLPLGLYTRDQLQQFDHIAKEELKMHDLMQTAGQVVFQTLYHRWPAVRNVLIFCGQGNNGGDGYVIARLAKEQGYNVRVVTAGHLPGSGAALVAFEAARRVGVLIESFKMEGDRLTDDVDLIIDALFGIGLNKPIRGIYQHIIDQINKVPVPVIAVDIPSGLSADSGEVLGCAVVADITVTFIGLKQGLLTGQGPDYAGEIIYNDLNIPTHILHRIPPSAHRLVFSKLMALLKPRPRCAHKGNFGHVVVVGGQPGMSGAVQMAAHAALRVGAGKVTVLTHPQHAAFININSPEIMSYGVTKEDETAREILASATVVVFGPGLGKSNWAQNLFHFILETTHPLIMDADALNLLALNERHRDNWILTPHPGEARRLLAHTTDTIRTNRFTAVTSLQKRYGGVVVLKGAGTLIKAPSHPTYLCDAGNPGMATAGMGDILSGIIGGLLAQGLPLADSAYLGVCLHAQVGDAVAARYGQRGMQATDLLPYIRKWVNNKQNESFKSEI